VCSPPQPKGAQLVSSWLKSAPDAFESLFCERSNNQLDAEAEALLREAAGKKVLLHLERARTTYEASNNKAELLLKAEVERRRSSISGAAKDGFGVAVGATPQSASALDAAPPDKPRANNASPRAAAAKKRRSSTGSLS
jgi:hypothetical protein